jgi:hypothetical protein
MEGGEDEGDSSETPEELHYKESSDLSSQFTPPPEPQKTPKPKAVGSNPPCFYCQSTKVSKNGKKRGKQCYKCGECGKSFTQSIDE